MTSASPARASLEPGGGVSFHHHDGVGSRMARKRLVALRFDSDTIDAVAQLIDQHLRFFGYAEGAWTDSAVRRYVRDAGRPARTAAHPDAGRCDDAQPAQQAARLAGAYDDIEARIAELREQEELDSIRPQLHSNRIQEVLGIRPGPDVGRAYRFLLDLRLDEGVLGTEECRAAPARMVGCRRLIPPPPPPPPPPPGVARTSPTVQHSSRVRAGTLRPARGPGAGRIGQERWETRMSNDIRTEDAPTPELTALAEAYGVATEYWSFFGDRVHVPAATLRAILAAMGVDAQTDRDAAARARGCPGSALAPARAAIGRGPRGLGSALQVHVADGHDVSMTVILEDASVRDIPIPPQDAEPRTVDGGTVWRLHVPLPDDLPLGWHTIPRGPACARKRASPTARRSASSSSLPRRMPPPPSRPGPWRPGVGADGPALLGALAGLVGCR